MTLAPLREAADSLVKASTPQPFSTSKTSNWVARAGGLPDYIQHVAHGILRSGAGSESEAIQKAIGIVKRWASGGKNVDATTRAAAAKAVAQWEAMKGKQAAKATESYVPTWADERLVTDNALRELALLEQEIGRGGMIALLSAGDALEEAAGVWAPTMKRCASASSEMERHELHDGGQHVGTIAKTKGYGPSEGPRYRAFAINGHRIGDGAMKSQADAVGAVKRHLEEGPARVAPHRDGKFLVSQVDSYSGPTTYREYPDEGSARFAAGLPAQPSTPEQTSKVAAMAESLVFDLITVAGMKIPPLLSVQEALHGSPLAEGFVSGELRNFRGEWERGSGGHHANLTPSAVRSSFGSAKPPKVETGASITYEGGVVRASARARAAHAAKPQIAPKQPKDGPKVRTLADAVGKGAWTPSAGKATRTLKAQRVLEGDALVKAVSAGKATDTEHLHRAVNADGSLGQYTPARLALHQRIIENMLQGKGVHSGDAQAIFTAGGPASGKSGLVKTGDSAFERSIGRESTVNMPGDVVHADPDIIRTQLPEYQDLVKAGRSDASSLTHEEASFLAKQLTRIALGRQHHILVDTVGDSGPGKFAAKIEQAKRAGHKVSVHYATTDVENALRRAAKRAEETGRAVPEDYLRSAHRDVSTRFAQDISGDKLAIKDGELFRQFLLKGK